MNSLAELDPLLGDAHDVPVLSRREVVSPHRHGGERGLDWDVCGFRVVGCLEVVGEGGGGGEGDADGGFGERCLAPDEAATAELGGDAVAFVGVVGDGDGLKVHVHGCSGGKGLVHCYGAGEGVEGGGGEGGRGGGEDGHWRRGGGERERDG